MYSCNDCGKAFADFVAAQRAREDGCPTCGGHNID